MTTLATVTPLLIIFGLFLMDITLMLRLSRRYYRLVCVVPAGSVALPAVMPRGRLCGEDLEVAADPDGLQVRSTRRKHHILLRVTPDGRVRAGAAACMWLCLVGWVSVVGLMGVVALGRPLIELLGMLTVSGGMIVGVGLLLRWRTRRMIAVLERVLTRTAPVASGRRRGAG
jgi:hypothetical protein